jgi:hypothetical protein
VIGVKGGIFEISSEMEYDYYRSMFYHRNYDTIRAVYRAGNSQEAGMKLINVESPINLG